MFQKIEKIKENRGFKSLFEYYGFNKADEKKHPVIAGILKQLTPERIEKELKAVQAIKLPTGLQKWVKEYKKVGERNELICKWTFLGIQKLTFSSVPSKYKKLVQATKLKSTIFNFSLDDLADKKKMGGLVEEIISFSATPIKASGKDRQYVWFVQKLWTDLLRGIKKYPQYNKLKKLFLYDYQQFFNAMRYALLVNKNPELINLTEYRMYLSHNMQGMIFADIDLMASPIFDKKELITLREIVWRAQRMGRIGNSLTTWEREVYENDFTSEVFSLALIKNVIDIEQLDQKRLIISKIKKSDINKELFKEWEKNHREIKKLSRKIKSANISNYLKGLEKLILLHLISIGKK